MKSWTGVTTLAACGIDGALAEWQRDSIAPFLTNDQAAYDRISAACEDVSRTRAALETDRT